MSEFLSILSTVMIGMGIVKIIVALILKHKSRKEGN